MPVADTAHLDQPGAVADTTGLDQPGAVADTTGLDQPGAVADTARWTAAARSHADLDQPGTVADTTGWTTAHRSCTPTSTTAGAGRRAARAPRPRRGAVADTAHRDQPGTAADTAARPPDTALDHGGPVARTARWIAAA